MSQYKNPFLDFKFSELSNMISTIFTTKKRSSDMRAQGGSALQSIDDLEANADNILQEMTNRVTRQWGLDRIQYNFASSSEMLPQKLMNLFNITPYELNKRIQANPPLMGAEFIDGHDEIWIVEGNKKYQMNVNGVIQIKPYDKKYRNHLNIKPPTL